MLKKVNRKFQRNKNIFLSTSQILEGEKDNETILKINSILEDQKKENKISKNLYLHVKGMFRIFPHRKHLRLDLHISEALIDSAMENISKLTEETDSM